MSERAGGAGQGDAGEATPVALDNVKAGAMKRVLVADDEPSLRLLVSATIESDQYQVLEAADGDQAWMLIQRHQPEVALLDIQMPGRSGIELASAIRRSPALSGMHVILLTSSAQKEDVAAGLAAGADLYLTKPFSPLQLLTTVEQALGLENP